MCDKTTLIVDALCAILIPIVQWCCYFCIILLHYNYCVHATKESKFSTTIATHTLIVSTHMHMQGMRDNLYGHTIDSNSSSSASTCDEEVSEQADVLC